MSLVIHVSCLHPSLAIHIDLLAFPRSLGSIRLILILILFCLIFKPLWQEENEIWQLTVGFPSISLLTPQSQSAPGSHSTLSCQCLCILPEPRDEAARFTLSGSGGLLFAFSFTLPTSTPQWRSAASSVVVSAPPAHVPGPGNLCP